MKNLLTVAAVLLPLAAGAQYEPAPSSPPPGYQPAPPSYPPPRYAPPPAYGPSFHQRSPWYIGFGFGGGAGNVKAADGTTGSLDSFNGVNWPVPPTATDLTFNFKLGATLSPQLLVGFDITGITSLMSSGGSSSSATIANYDAVATFFPSGEGFFVRGGAGLSRLSMSWDFVNSTGSDAISGFNVLGGVGYAFWLGRSFNLTVNADYSFQSYGSASSTAVFADIAKTPETSNFFALWVGFDWY